MLDDACAAGRGEEPGTRRQVQAPRTIAARAHGFDGWRTVRNIGAHSELAHRAREAPNLFGRLAFCPQAREQRQRQPRQAHGRQQAQEQAAERYPDERAAAGRTLMHPFDHPDMMAGNGTVGLEIVEDVPDVTDVFVSVGGGGLLSGVVTAVRALAPTARTGDRGMTVTEFAPFGVSNRSLTSRGLSIFRTVYKKPVLDRPFP